MNQLPNSFYISKINCFTSPLISKREEPYIREFRNLPSVGVRQDLPAPYLGLSMIDRELCQATIAGIYACLRAMGPLSVSPKPLTPEEPADETLETMMAEAERDEEEINLLEVASGLEEEFEPGAEVDGHGAAEEPTMDVPVVGGDDCDSTSVPSPVRNLELNSQEYMGCLLDDRMAKADAEMMADSNGDLPLRIDAGFRTLDRHDLGLRRVPKGSAKKRAAKPTPKLRGRPASSSKSSSKSRAVPATTPKRRAAPAATPKSRTKPAKKNQVKKNKKVKQPKNKNKGKKVKKDENVLEKKLHSASCLHRDCSLLS